MAENLFPDIRDYSTGGTMRNYVSMRLAEMASEGTLFLTDCLNQPGTKALRDAIHSMVGDVIMGYNVGPDGYQRQGAVVPFELSNFKVRIRSIKSRVQVDEEQDDLSIRTKFVAKRKTVGWKDMPRVVGEAISLAEARNTANTYAQDQEFFEERYIDTHEHEVELSPREALLCLRQRGKNVKPAKSKNLQRFCWQVEEVRPGGQKDEGEKPKRIRRTKAQMQAARIADEATTEGPSADA